MREAFADQEITWVEQREQLGTGHALAQVERHLDGPARLLVLSGDVPLVRPATLERVVASAAGSWGALAVAQLEEPGSLGRVVVERGRLQSIVEAANASEAELASKNINVGLYLLPAPGIFTYLAALEPDPVKGELYLTDALNAAAARAADHRQRARGPGRGAGHQRPAGSGAGPPGAARPARRRAAAGRGDPARPDSGCRSSPRWRWVPTRFSTPTSGWVASTRVGRNCRLHQGVWIRDSRLGDGVEVAPYSVLDGAEVGDGCRVGPYARLRPGAVLDEGARVGNFVEVKNARLGPGVKAGHLAYLGDAEIGAGANIGAGAVTCNYDGKAKHRTVIGERAFIGSDTMLVAPVEVGDDAVTGAGSVITHDVPPGALAVERSRQRTVPDWNELRMRRKRDED